MKNQKLRISIMGPQGSGKTTQARLLADFLGIPFIGIGDILRQKSNMQDEMGKKIKEDLEKGSLVDDEIVAEITKREAKKFSDSFVMDGYPRSLKQLELFNPDFDKVFYLAVDDSEVINRLLNRSREDDTLELIKERLRLYHQLTVPLLASYKEKGILHIIDGSGSINKIQMEIRQALNG